MVLTTFLCACETWLSTADTLNGSTTSTSQQTSPHLMAGPKVTEVLERAAFAESTATCRKSTLGGQAMWSECQTADFQSSYAAEARRITEAQRKPAVRTAPTHTCPTCGRSFRARIGLASYLRNHIHRSSLWLEAMVILDIEEWTTTTIIGVICPKITFNP